MDMHSCYNTVAPVGLALLYSVHICTDRLNGGGGFSVCATLQLVSAVSVSMLLHQSTHNGYSLPNSSKGYLYYPQEDPLRNSTKKILILQQTISF